MAKTRISKLRVNEVSLVDRPANPIARVILAKRDEEEGLEKKGTCSYCDKSAVKDGMCAEHGKMSKAYDLSTTLDVSVDSIVNDETLTKEEQVSALRKTLGQYETHLLALVATEQEITKMADTKKDETVAPAEVLKSLSPEQTKVVEDLIAKTASGMLDKIEKAQKEAQAARDEIAKRDREALAKSMVGNTAVKPEDVAKALESHDAAKELLKDVLAKYDTAIKAGSVLKEIGSEHGDKATGSEDALNKAIETLQKSDSKLSKEQAFAKAIAANPKLYDDYLTGK